MTHLHKTGRWTEIVDHAELPAPIAETVTLVVRKTKLRKGEKRELATELTAHFADGLDAGESPHLLLEMFGDPQRNARLMRRAKKRCRGPIWKAWVLTLRAAGAMLGVVLLVYAVLATIYFTAEPRVTTDYARQLQDRVLAENPGPAKWERWIEVWGDRPELPAHPDDPGDVFDAEDAWTGVPSLVAQAIDDARPWLDRVRELALAEGSLRWPHYRNGVPEAFAALAARRGDDRYAGPTGPWDNDEPLFELQLPYLEDLRRDAAWLGLDAAVAAQEGDAPRVVRTVLALTAIAEEAGEMPTLINWLVKARINTIAIATVSRTLARQPAVFDRAQLRDLAHALGRESLVAPPPLEGERVFVHDWIQRTYSEGGIGGGRLTSAGLDRLYDGIAVSPSPPPMNAAEKIAGPVAMAITASRNETERVYEGLMDDLALWGQTPPWDRGADPLDRFFHASEVSPRIRHPLLAMIMPAVSSVYTNGDTLAMRRDGALVALALAAHRLEHGRWPETLAELTPAYLPSVPRDMHTGEPLRYRLTDDGPLLYSVGPDRTDDRGVWAEDHENIQRHDASNAEPAWIDDDVRGDWILFRLGSIEPTEDEPRFQPDEQSR